MSSLAPNHRCIFFCSGEHALHIAVVNCLKSEYWAPELRSGAYRDGVHSPSNDMLMFLVESKSDRLERKKMLNDANTTGTFFDRKSEYHLVCHVWRYSLYLVL